jgi:acyl-CoA thioester hydrolase
MEGFPCVVEQRVAFRDLDALGHVNNAVYASYFETGRVEYLAAVSETGVIDPFHLILAELTITYKSPAFLRETLLIGTRITEMRNSSFVVEGRIEEKTTGRLVATSRAVVVHYDYKARRSAPIPQHWREAISRFEGRDFGKGE